MDRNFHKTQNEMSEATATQRSPSENRITKTEFLKKIQTNIDESHKDMDSLIEKSKIGMMSAQDFEAMFDILYDVKDMVQFYYKQLNLSNDDELVSKEKDWCKKHMDELIECRIGQTAEIKCFKTENIKSKNGNSVGEVDEIRVRFIPYESKSFEIPLKNWVEIDRWFWTKDHAQKLDDYEASVRTRTRTTPVSRSSSYDYYDDRY